MKKVLCAADPGAFLPASIFSVLLGAALLCAPAMADPAAGPASPESPASSAKSGELEEITVTAESANQRCRLCRSR